MLPYPTLDGLSKGQRRTIIRHLEAATSAEHLVALSDPEQLLEILNHELAKNSERNPNTSLSESKMNMERGNLGLVLAVVSELSHQTLGMRPRPGQLAVAAALAEGYLVEFPTGEGKTLSSAIAAIWLAGVHGTVHVATENEYLAGRDVELMRPLYERCGLTVGVVLEGSTATDRSQAHRARIVYGTLSGFASDYLGDHLINNRLGVINPAFHALIVDEADALLVDAATSPFLLVGTANLPVDVRKYLTIASSMRRGVHFDVDESRGTVWMLPDGVVEAQSALDIENLYEHGSDVQWLHAALLVGAGEEESRLFREGVHYVVDGGAPVHLDRSGRPRPKSRLPGGLHPMLRALTGATPGKLPVSVARISTRAFVNLYEHVCGTAGTLLSDDAELRSVYGRPVIGVSPDRPSVRVDHAGKVYATRAAKLAAITEATIVRHRKRQPVLIGAGSVEDAEDLASLLEEAHIPFNLLTARDHRREASVIEDAGRAGAVTVTARMAGRGVDIRLGGKDGSSYGEVVRAGGLAVIAVERFDSRRADRQLRGRCGRQGEPGETLTYASCEDHLVSVFAGAKLSTVLPTTKEFDNPDELLVPGIVPMIDRAQRQLEQMNADIRRSQLIHDMQRTSQTNQFYRWRQHLLMERDLRALIEQIFTVNLPAGRWNRRGVLRNPSRISPLWPEHLPFPGGVTTVDLPEVLSAVLWSDLRHRLDEAGSGRSDALAAVEAAEDALVSALIEIADGLWARHLATLASLESSSDAVGNDPRVGDAAEMAFDAFNRDVTEQYATMFWNARFNVSPSS
jgi:preprotein translocase subunit SecA